MKKKLCSICHKNIAKWLYMPCSSKKEPFYCDDCVPRGCSCNMYLIEEIPYDIPSENVIFWDKDMINSTRSKTEDSFYYELTDIDGRRLPCCEYWYDEDGWEDENI